MNVNHLNLLSCPKTKKKLKIENASVIINKRIKEGVLKEPYSGNEYQIANSIPRFVENKNYTKNFSSEWNIHNTTQYAEYSGYDISKRRF